MKAVMERRAGINASVPAAARSKPSGLISSSVAAARNVLTAGQKKNIIR